MAVRFAAQLPPIAGAEGVLEQRDQTGSDTFTITMTRAELAAYLNCDRSALSRELSRMQEDGLIELFRSTFKLPDPERLANEM